MCKNIWKYSIYPPTYIHLSGSVSDLCLNFNAHNVYLL